MLFAWFVCAVVIAFSSFRALAESVLQRQTLYEFYQATSKGPNGGGWATKCHNGWISMGNSVPNSTLCNSPFAPSYSNYYGLRCSGFEGEIVQLALTGCNLQGTLSPSLDRLTSLVTLDLFSNQLTGTLPSQWANAMIEMRFLYLDNNLLTGTLPAQWATFRTLLKLHLSTNRLTGTLPWQWSAMTTLQSLMLDSNQLRGTLPAQWSRLSSLQALQLHLNNLAGTVPSEWPEGMRSLQRGENICSATCVIEGDRVLFCQYQGKTCLWLYLWYNCLDGSTLPPVNASNAWNWGDSSQLQFRTHQRDVCPLPQVNTPTLSPTMSGSLLISTTAAGTRSNHSGTWSDAAGTPTAATFTTTTTKSLRSEEFSSTLLLLPQAPPVPPPSLRLLPNIWAGSTTTIGTALSSVGSGVGSALTVQRAVVQAWMLLCGADEGEDLADAPLDLISSPTQLGYGSGAGEMRGRYLRGALVGNLAVLVGFALVAMFVTAGCVYWTSRRDGATLRQPSSSPTTWRQRFADATQLLHLPGLFHIPVMILFQPMVSCGVWCVSSGVNGADIALGTVVGLLLPLGYAGYATRICIHGPRRQPYQSGPAIPSTTASSPSSSSLWSACMRQVPPVAWRMLCGMQPTIDEEGQDARVDSAQPRSSQHPIVVAPSPGDHDHQRSEAFVKRYGTIVCTYRTERQWFIVVEMGLALACGVLGGVALADDALCSTTVVLPVLYVLLLLVALLLTVSLQPYSEPLDHIVNVVGLMLSVFWAFSVLAKDDAAAFGLSEVQMWLGLVTLFFTVLMLLGSPSFRARWLSRRRWGTAPLHGTQEEQVTPAKALEQLVQQVCNSRNQLLLLSTDDEEDDSDERRRSSRARRRTTRTAAAAAVAETSMKGPRSFVEDHPQRALASPSARRRRHCSADSRNAQLVSRPPPSLEHAAMLEAVIGAICRSRAGKNIASDAPPLNLRNRSIL